MNATHGTQGNEYLVYRFRSLRALSQAIQAPDRYNIESGLANRGHLVGNQATHNTPMKSDISESEKSDSPSDAELERRGFSWIGPAAIVFYVFVVVEFLFWLSPRGTGAIDYTEIAVVAGTLGLSTIVACFSAVVRSSWRWLFFGIANIWLTFLLTTKVSPTPVAILFFLPLITGLPTILTLEVIKRFVGKFQRHADTEGFTEGLQFGIKNLAVLTTIVAVLMGLRSILESQLAQLSSTTTQLTVVIITIVCVMSFNTLLGVWAILGKANWLRILIAALAIPASSSLAPIFAIRRIPGIWITVFSTAAVATILILTCLRIEGYRFVKRPSTD